MKTSCRLTNIQGVKFKIKAITLYFCVSIQTINYVEIFYNLLYFTMNYYWYGCLQIRQTWYTKLYVLMLTSTMTMYITLVSILSKKNRQAITLVSPEQIHTSSILLCLLIHVHVWVEKVGPVFYYGTGTQPILSWTYIVLRKNRGVESPKISKSLEFYPKLSSGKILLKSEP